MNRLKTLILVPIAIFIAIGLPGCGDGDRQIQATGTPSELTYVGVAICTDCHEKQAERWRGSHHQLAMQPPNETSILGKFDDSEFSHNGVTTRFFTRDGKYLVETDGQDGQLEEFPVRFAFGVEPLQQYLLELPGGEIQTLGASWDSRPEAEGGQRWFHVYGDEFIDHNDVLHWTRPGQNWDTMCAFCHSTGLEKTFDLETKAFDTTWAEINVACEACHGPGSRHVDWAVQGQQDNQSKNYDSKGFTARLDERDGVRWILNPDSGNSRRDRLRTTQTEIDTCAACHSRRSQISRLPLPGNELLDTFRPALIQTPLYHADGQIRDEVYVYGSFLQSRMYQHGVTCSDCHDPHSLKLRAPGPQVCLQCHAADKFATTEHHLHDENSTGANCIECHMPPTTYMQVDSRHDHSFRIPRPDLGIRFDTPDACTNCHAKKSQEWAADVLRSHDKLRDKEDHWQQKLALILNLQPGTRELILELSTDKTVPAIVRASVIVQAVSFGDAALIEKLAEQAGSDDPLVRWAVARLLQAAPAPVVAKYASQLIEDPLKAVRIDAASALASVALELLPVRSQSILQTVLAEYIEAELVNNERAEAHVNIGNLQRNLRRPENSERAYLTALDLNPFFVPAYVNLSDLYREQEREADGEILLRTALDLLPEQPSLHYALGLSLVRQGRAGESREELRLAAVSADAEPRMALAYALILDLQGETGAAIDYLNGSLERFGDDPGLLSALINMYQRTNQRKAAEPLIMRLRSL